MLICTGPFDIPPGATAVAAFAMCGGYNLTDLQATSRAAQLKYDTVISGSTAIAETAGVVGPVYALRQNVPNPFNPATRIGFALPAGGQVSLKVYNLTGKLVRTLLDEPVAAGPGEVTWDGRDDAGRAVASGTYFYELRVDGRVVQSRKMQLMK
jgi:flagellar hook assembly protein FlgD